MVCIEVNSLKSMYIMPNTTILVCCSTSNCAFEYSNIYVSMFIFNFSDNRFRHLFFKFYQKSGVKMVATWALTEEIKFGSHWAARSLIECAVAGAVWISFNATEGSCYRVSVTPLWP